MIYNFSRIMKNTAVDVTIEVVAEIEKLLERRVRSRI